MPGGKYFWIRAQMNNLVLDVKEGCVDSGTRVVLWEKKEEDAENQLFYLDHGCRCIRTKLADNMCLDFDEDDNALTIEEYEGKDSQKWDIQGERIFNRDDRDMVFDVAMGDDEAGEAGSRICKWEWQNNDNQKWEFDQFDATFFFVKSEMNGKVWDIPHADDSTGVEVVMWDQGDGEDHQLWYEDLFGNIRSKLNDFVLDASQGDELRMERFDGNEEQMWYKYGPKIVSRADDDKVIDIIRKDDDNGAKLCMYRYKENDNQHWTFEYVD